jgi:hypothetical protein
MILDRSVEGRQSMVDRGKGVETNPKDTFWSFWPLLPLYPYAYRRTLRTEVIPDSMWTFEQLQGIFYVVAPIRMTIIRLEAGGLLVYAPVAPTRECVRLVRELEAQYGSVQYIILPTASGLEHKVFVGPFARKFPQAKVYVAPHQWSFPLNLPLSWAGLPLGRTYRLPESATETPFAQDFDYTILGPIQLGLGVFEEVALFHKRSHTLLLTDTIVSIPAEPPAIAQLDPYPLLFHAKDRPSDRIEDTPQNRLKGWHRIALFAFYFRPGAVETVPLMQAWRDAVLAPDRSRRAYFGLFPFQWQQNWEATFAALHQGGNLFVAPILQQLILNRAPQETLDWVLRVSDWAFQRIIPCHFDAPVMTTPRHFQQAFQFLKDSAFTTHSAATATQSSLSDDFKLLRQIDQNLTRWRITPPAK